MPRQYINGTRLATDRAIDQLDRPKPARQRTSCELEEQGGVLMMCPPAKASPQQRPLLQQQYAAGTVHTGTVKPHDKGFVVSFGRIWGFLPTEQLGNASPTAIVKAGRLRVAVLELDGQLRARLTRVGM